MRNRRPHLEGPGFTLLEVMVALAIMGIGVVTIIQLYAGGLRMAKISEDYTMAALLARQKMEEVIANEEPEAGAWNGAIEGTHYVWEAEVEPFPLGEEGSDRYAGLEAYIFKIRVKWPGITRWKMVELSTLKTVTSENPPQPKG